MSNRTIVILSIAGILLAAVVGYANYSYSSSLRSSQQQSNRRNEASQRRFAEFRKSICALQESQQKGQRGFVNLLQTLERRAVVREHADAAAGNVRDVQADSDSARLYQSVLDQYAIAATRPRVTLDCP